MTCYLVKGLECIIHDASQMLQVFIHLDKVKKVKKVKKHTLCLIGGKIFFHELSTMEPNVRERLLCRPQGQLRCRSTTPVAFFSHSSSWSLSHGS